jgi:hypothetical protein
LEKETKKKSWQLRLGIILILVCIPFFLAIPVLPFLGWENKIKITAGTVLLILGEVLFWSGGLLVGKELFIKYRSYMNPKNWFRKEKGDQSLKQ